MSLSSNVPQIVFTPQGLVIPSDTDILAGTQEDMNTAFGGGLNPQLSTPQGQLASSQAAIVSDKDSEIALICNQVDPQFATGRFQDAIARIYFLFRHPATATVVTGVIVNGPIGTVISAGALAQDTNNNTYFLTADITIPSSGSTTASFQNILSGPIPCLAGTLIKTYQAVGWDSITNPSDGVLGQNVETPAAFEFRRKQSVAINGRGTVPSIYGNVFAVANVLDAFAIDNPEGVIVHYGSTNFPLAPHSLYVAVLGGIEQDILNAIWNKKDTGCDYNGNTEGQVIDPSGYSFPQPTYNVRYEIPAPLPIFFAVQIVNLPSLPSNIVALIQAAIIAQFSGTNGAVMARIGSLILATSFFGPVAASAPNVLIVTVAVGTAANPTGPQVQVGIDQTPTISAANIAVTLV